MTAPPRLGVGIVGCGAAAQAIHLGALGTLPDLFDVVHCSDPVGDVAATVAGRLGPDVRSSTSFDDLLGDDRVDVVVVCSPGPYHAEQVVAACERGVKAVLCEKPVAESNAGAQAMLDASRSSGVPVVVGTMHRHDPALQALVAAWGDLPSEATFVRSTAFIPPNAAIVAKATELATSSVPPGDIAPPRMPTQRPDTPQPIELLMFRGLMLGLAVHHLPLVRLVADPAAAEVEEALPLGAAGYHVELRSGDVAIHLDDVLHQLPWIDWSFEVAGPRAWARVDFPPGYMTGKSAVGSLRWVDASGIRREERFVGHETGYRAEWRHVHQVALGEVEPLTGIDGGAADVAVALRLADEADAGWPA